MTEEIKHIIEKKRFRRSWDDYLSYFGFVVPIAVFILGLELAIRRSVFKENIAGLILIIASVFLTRFLLIRTSQLNEFEEIRNEKTQEENFAMVLQGLSQLNIVEIDKDLHNCAINARYKTKLLPPVFEWLTIICLDNRVLVNSRPIPAVAILWIRRNAMIDFKRVVANARTNQKHTAVKDSP